MTLNLNPHLDTAYLLHTYGEDKELILLLFKAFLSDSVEKWKVLESVIENDDLLEAARIVHTIKPSFLMVGMGVLKPAVLHLERMIKEKEQRDVLREAYGALDIDMKRYEQILLEEITRLENN
jgi:HPt (histidine-containing phosphotransfer) domain-containing protein